MCRGVLLPERGQGWWAGLQARFRQERSMFKAVVQVGVRGWRGLEPFLVSLKGVTYKSYLIIWTTMGGPISKLALDQEKMFYG